MNGIAAPLHGAAAAGIVATVLGLAFGRLSPGVAWTSLTAGVVVAVATIVFTPRTKIAKVRLDFWSWAAITLFALFSLRAFLWVVFQTADEIKVLSPNNLGDLALHLTYIRQMASGAAFWPENPILHHSLLSYPLGVDLLHSLLVLAGADVFRIFAWLGLAGAVLTGCALWKWGRAFAIGGFLCNGGLAGFAILASGELLDYQGPQAWKSIPLALFVTQRGFLFAFPAGLLLLESWRRRYFPGEEQAKPLPLWSELLLYAALPLFHLHTFFFFSLLLLGWFAALGRVRWRVLQFVALALLPASGLVYLVTGGFHGASMLGWQAGWMQSEPEYLDFAEGVFGSRSPLLTVPFFWLLNFGVLPVALAVVIFKAWRARDARALAFLLPATAIFLLCCFVKLAQWEWDNTKVMVWSYLTILPFVWTGLLARWNVWARGAAVVALFGSGLVSLLGGIDAKHRGHVLAYRSELDMLAAQAGNLLLNERFIAHPTYDHPLLLLGRPLAMGYPGHVWSHGYGYQETQDKIQMILEGQDGWREAALAMDARYLYWGRPEEETYPGSSRPWRREVQRVAAGEWGEIFDLTMPLSPPGSAAAK